MDHYFEELYKNLQDYGLNNELLENIRLIIMDSNEGCNKLVELKIFFQVFIKTSYIILKKHAKIDKKQQDWPEINKYFAINEKKVEDSYSTDVENQLKSMFSPVPDKKRIEIIADKGFYLFKCLIKLAKECRYIYKFNKLINSCINTLNVIDLFLIIESALVLKDICLSLQQQREPVLKSKKKLNEIEKRLAAFLSKIDDHLKNGLALKPKELRFEIDYGLLVEISNLDYELQDLKFNFDERIFSLKELKMKTIIQIRNENVKTTLGDGFMLLSPVLTQNSVFEGFNLSHFVAKNSLLFSIQDRSKKIEHSLSGTIGKFRQFEKLSDVCVNLRHFTKMVKLNIDKTLNELRTLKEQKIVALICQCLLVLVFVAIYLDIVLNQGKFIDSMVKSVNFTMLRNLK